MDPLLPHPPSSGRRRPGSPDRPMRGAGSGSGPRSCTAALLATALLAVPLGCASGQQPRPPDQADITPSVRASWEALGLSMPGLADESVLTVTGTAEVEAQPDRARLFFAVETEGETAQEAGESNALLMTRVTEALRAAGAGAPGLRIETAGYSLTPRYGPIRDDRAREIVGYTARNTVQLRVDEITRAGELIDTALGAGANRVLNLQFEVQDPEPYRHEAMRDAVRRARAEAEVIAEALGMRLGPALDVQGGADPVFPRSFAMAEDRAFEMAQATPVDPGLQTVSARVTIRFRLNESP